MSDNAKCYVNAKVFAEVLAEHPGQTHHPAALHTALERQGLCLSLAVPSVRAARLPAPAGLTQAKGVSRGERSSRPRASDPLGPSDLRSIRRPVGCGRVGGADLIGDSRQCGCTNTEASLVDPASTLTRTRRPRMIVGIDVHKHSHAAALLDERGGVVATLFFANTPRATSCLIAWLVDHDAATASSASRAPAPTGAACDRARRRRLRESCRCRAGAPTASATARARAKPTPATPSRSPRWSSRDREQLGPAQEPELGSRARDARAPAPSPGPRPHPGDPASARRLDPARPGRRGRRDPLRPPARAGKAESAAARREPRRAHRARCIRELARDIDDLNKRIGRSTARSPSCLRSTATRWPTCRESATNLTATIIAQAGDVRRFRDTGAFARFCGTATDPLRLRPNGRSSSSAPRRQPPAELGALPDRDRPGRHHPQARAYLARKPREGKTPREARRALKRHLANVLYRRLNAWAEQAPAMHDLT